MNEKEKFINQPVLLILGPVGSDKDFVPYSQPKFRYDISWTPAVSESTVKRFLGEANYFLQIYNVVVQHFVRILPSEKYFVEDDSDSGRRKRKRDSIYACLWNAQFLDELLNLQFDEAQASAALPEDEDPDEIDLEVEKSFQSLRELIESSSTVWNPESISQAVSLQELLQTPPAKGPSLISKAKEKLMTLLDDEVAKLRKKIQLSLPEFAEKKVNKLNKLVMKTLNYSDYITKVELIIGRGSVIWPAFDYRNFRLIDLREDYKELYHVIYAPAYIINKLEAICVSAYILLKKTKELEKAMKTKDPIAYAKLQEAKEEIVFPKGNDQLIDVSYST